MKLLLVACLSLVLSTERVVSLQQARLVFENAAKNEQIAADFLTKVTFPPNNILLGYKGAVTMIMAKHAFSPLKKLEYFNLGRAFLDQALKTEPNNIELRYLRFSIQCNSPSFLGYHNEKKSDKVVLLQEISRVTDAELKRKITQYLLQCSELTAQEKLALH
ncbi:MAG: hypothetical protein EAY81_07635 [Bacteroidetes bacterium]|nr:MAG: hypothetical protein EAY81_07635 [Bacteroidota bacterium]